MDPRGGGVGGGPLGLTAGWVAHRLVFAARGAGPFQLAYGRRDATPAAFPIATLIPNYKPDAELDVARAEVGTQRPLGGPAPLRAPVDWKRWTLWGSLGLGVALLGWMAMRLARQMSAVPGVTGDPPSREPDSGGS